MKKLLWVVLVTLVGALSLSCSSEQSGERTSLARDASYEDDEDNCGAEGYVCVAGRTCVDYRCDPPWIEIEDMGAPTDRGAAAAGFIDGKYIVFGGCAAAPPGSTGALSSSGIYDPEYDSWSAGPALPSGRLGLAAVSTDAGVFINGGLGTCWDGGTTGYGLSVLYDLGGDWVEIPAADAPEARYSSSLTWTGDKLFVFGGATSGSGAVATGGILGLGSAWKGTTCEVENCAKGSYFASFYDRGLIHVVGDNGPTGSLYDIEHDAWYGWEFPTSTPDFATDITPGGFQVRYADDGQRVYFVGNSGHMWIYDRNTEEWIDDPTSPPSGLCNEGATAWTGSELIVWSGVCGGTISSVGGRYQPPAPGVSP